MIKQARALAAALLCGALLSSAIALVPGTPADAASSWYEGPCRPSDSNGVTVVVDFHDLAAATIVRCSPVPGNDRSVRRTGLQALVDAGIDVSGTTRWGDNYPTSVPFVCRIQGRPAADEPLVLKRLSEPYFEPCNDTPPADAYWSYWHSDGASDWTYSQRGVMDRRVTPGGFEGWSFSLNKSADDHIQPRVQPVNSSNRLTFSVDATEVDAGKSVTLSWDSTGVERVVASGDWDGQRLASGSEKIVLRSAGTYTFTLATVGTEPVQTRSVTVEVEPTAEQGQASSEPSRYSTLANSSAAWLIGELQPRGQMPGPSGVTDWGLTIDTLWALHAARTGASAARDIVRQVESNIGQYMGTELFGDDRARVGGAVAKLLVAAVVAGEDPQAFGGYDLRRETLDLISTRRQDRGRLTSRNTGNDQTNVFAQSLAVIGLARSGAVEASAVDFLARQQCSAGYFRMFLDDSSCDAARAPADTDGTAMGVQALIAARDAGTSGLDDAIDRAVAWLLSAQQSSGAFTAGAGSTVANSNSTGLAAQALAAAEPSATSARRATLTQARERAARWVSRRQVSSSTAAGSTLLKMREQGAIAYTSQAFNQAKSAGIGSGRDQWRRATAQAVFALSPVALTTLGRVELAGDPTVQNRPSAADQQPRADVPAPVAPDASESLKVVGSAASGKVASGSATRQLSSYLTRQLTDGDHIEVTDGDTTYVDYDATADVAIAFAALGQRARAAKVARFLLHADSIAAYAYGQPYEKSRAAYAEPLSKLVLIARMVSNSRAAARLDADLSAVVRDGVATDVGQYPGDLASTVRAAWIALALAAGDHPDTAAATGVLLTARCPDGGFATHLKPTASTCKADAKTTAMVVSALNAVRGVSSPARQANVAPRDWSGHRLEAIESAALAATGATLSDGTAATTGTAPGDVGALAITRQVAGLGAWPTLDALATAQRPDGGFSATARGRSSDLTASSVVALALDGRPWLTQASLPLRLGVQLPLAAPVSEATTPSSGRGWLWSVLTVMAVVLAAAAGSLVQKAKRS